MFWVFAISQFQPNGGLFTGSDRSLDRSLDSKCQHLKAALDFCSAYLNDVEEMEQLPVGSVMNKLQMKPDILHFKHFSIVSF